MRSVGRTWLVAVLLLITGLVVIGWKYASRDASEPSRASAHAFSSQVVQRIVPTPTTGPATVTYVPPLALADTGVLRGRVIDAATKAPIREFTIEFFATPAAKPTPGARVFQTKDGRFEWTSVPADVWEVTAGAPGYQRFEFGEVLIRKGAATPEVVLPLRRGFTVTGRVFDELTRTGIENATVSFWDAQQSDYGDNWRRRLHTSTDRNGSFVLDGVPGGRITIHAGSQDHANRAVTISVGPDLAPLQIALSAGSLISGQLTAADGATGVAGWVELSNLDSGTAGMAKSGPNGEFIYKRLSSGRYRVMGRSETGQAEIEIALAPNERRENVVLALKTGSVVRGTITGLSAGELRRTNISVQNATDYLVYMDTQIDARGKFTIGGLKPGRVRVVVDVSLKLQLARVVDLPPDSERTVDFDFARGVRLSGRVTRNGKPWPQVMVAAHPVGNQDEFQVYPVATSAQGAYAFDKLPYGDYVLMVVGHRTPTVRVDSDKEFDIDVPAAATFEGQVSEDPSGVPIVGARVDLRPAEVMSKLLPRATETDHFGRFTEPNLPPGDYIVTIYKTDFAMYRERLSLGTATERHSVRLQPERGVRVHVSTASGKRLEAVRATEIVAGQRVAGMLLRLDEEGSAYLPGGLAGSGLSFTAAGFEPIEIRAWDGRELELRFVPQSQR